ncbi:hypothetical protein [Yoonia sp.]|uniref:hypothetical protein n=1 Tax=Yoonia sp. TaxID=2212373 RepID=UPI0023B3C014
MGHDWIIDVLADMRRFARQNDMPLLCAQLDDAMMVATAEVANMRTRPSMRSGDHGVASRPRGVE